MLLCSIPAFHLPTRSWKWVFHSVCSWPKACLALAVGKWQPRIQQRLLLRMKFSDIFFSFSQLSHEFKDSKCETVKFLLNMCVEYNKQEGIGYRQQSVAFALFGNHVVYVFNESVCWTVARIWTCLRVWQLQQQQLAAQDAQLSELRTPTFFFWNWLFYFTLYSILIYWLLFCAFICVNSSTCTSFSLFLFFRPDISLNFYFSFYLMPRLLCFGFWQFFVLGRRLFFFPLPKSLDTTNGPTDKRKKIQIKWRDLPAKLPFKCQVVGRTKSQPECTYFKMPVLLTEWQEN